MDLPTTELLNVEVPEDGVAVVQLARKPVNALSGPLLDEIGSVFDALAADGSVRSVVVTGGERNFSAGADVEEFLPLASDKGMSIARHFHENLGKVSGFPGAVIAAINGYALGGGLELALACDFRVAGEMARLGLPEILLGIIPGGGGTVRLARLVGPARAKDLVFSGRHARAQEALDIGLVDKVVPPDAVLETAVEQARQLASGATAAMALAKRSIDGGLGLELGSALELETACFGEVFTTRDAQTGVDSFLEHGPGKAEFEGR